MLPIIVAGSRPAAAVFAQKRPFNCDTSVELHRLRHVHVNIAETGRARLPFSSTGLLNPIGSHPLPTRSSQIAIERAAPPPYPLPRFPLLEVFERRPPTAVFAVPSVIGRHPKTFTLSTELFGASAEDCLLLPQERPKIVRRGK